MINPNSGTVLWSPGVSLENMIQQVVEASMVFYKGNKTAVAQSLGIAIRTLDARLDKYKKESQAHGERTEQAKNDRADFIKRQRAIPQAAQFANTATPGLGLQAWEARQAQLAAKAASAPEARPQSSPQSLANTAEKRAVPVPKPEKI